MRRLIIFTGIVLLLALLTINLKYITPAHAGQETVDVYENRQLVKSVVFVIGRNEYFVDGQVPGARMDARPFIKDGRTFVPVRYLGSALGVTGENITWDGGQKRVALSLGGNSVEMVVGVARITAGGQVKDIDVAPVLNESEGRTYLPARYIAEGLGYEVAWDEATQIVLCWPKGTQKPDISAVKQYLKESAGKPEAVRELEGLFGVNIQFDHGTTWGYAPTRTEQNNNRNRSYLDLYYDSEDGAIIVQACWATILSDIRNVELDLSPIEKVLNWKFPDQPDKVKEIMAYARQVAEKTRESDRTERAPWKEYYVDGCKVSIGSIGFNFVEAIITKN
ncbi:MAG: copper amine oxidase N-terminal domain-containing protein [Peptococcaceae bacterium]|nr:copper amine oxidase N-terminal domain-containing protein [Peptococcaceae bacterium]